MRRLQQDISRSKLSWPIAAMITVVLWFVAWLEDNVTFLPLLLLIVSGLQLMWINHIFALIRRFSRMIASSFLVYNAAFLLVPDLGGVQTKLMLLQLCLISFLTLFFSCYQYRKAQGIILYAFLMIGLASLFFKQILFLVPLLWLLTSYCMVTFSAKIWLSSIFGVLLPYIFVYSYYILAGTPPEEQTLIHNWQFGRMFYFRYLSVPLLIASACSTLLSVLGAVHLLREGHKDKVRTRMMYQIFMTIGVFAFVMTILQPQHIAYFTAMQLIPASAMTGHFFALTESKESNATFIGITLATLAIAICHLWNF